MGLAVRSTSQVAAQTTATFSLSKPAGTTDGDLIVIFQDTYLAGGGVPAAPGEGWSTLTDLSYNVAGHRLQVWYKTASGEPASWTLNNSSGGLMPAASATAFAVSGGATIEGSSSAAGSSASADPGAYTTTHANALILTGWAIGTNLGETITPHASYTAVGRVGGSSEAQNAGSKAQASAGAVANRTAALSGSLSWGAYLVSLYAAAAAPVASFTRTPASGMVGVTVSVTDTSTNTPTSWDWDWGDGTAHSTTQNPTHQYTRSGVFTITLTATNAGGSSQATATVTVNAGAGGAIHSVVARPPLRKRVGRRR